MRNTSGTRNKKIVPSSVKISTNATIVAWRWTIPDIEAYARVVAVTGSLPRSDERFARRREHRS